MFIITMGCLAWWPSPVIPPFRRWRLKDPEFKASLDHIVEALSPTTKKN
jgi:hypothetical protein